MKNGHMIDRIIAKHTGGNCLADFAHLKDGRVVCITNDCIGVYPSDDCFEDGKATGFIEVGGEHLVSTDTILENGKDAPGFFIAEHKETEVSNGHPAELLILGDGTAICIAADSLVYYKSEEAFRDAHRDGDLGYIELKENEQNMD